MTERHRPDPKTVETMRVRAHEWETPVLDSLYDIPGGFPAKEQLLRDVRETQNPVFFEMIVGTAGVGKTATVTEYTRLIAGDAQEVSQFNYEDAIKYSFVDMESFLKWKPEDWTAVTDYYKESFFSQIKSLSKIKRTSGKPVVITSEVAAVGTDDLSQQHLYGADRGFSVLAAACQFIVDNSPNPIDPVGKITQIVPSHKIIDNSRAIRSNIMGIPDEQIPEYLEGYGVFVNNISNSSWAEIGRRIKREITENSAPIEEVQGNFYREIERARVWEEVYKAGIGLEAFMHFAGKNAESLMGIPGYSITNDTVSYVNYMVSRARIFEQTYNLPKDTIRTVFNNYSQHIILYR